jgi:hypothetical protein
MNLTPLHIALLALVFICVCLFVNHLFEAAEKSNCLEAGENCNPDESQCCGNCILETSCEPVDSLQSPDLPDNIRQMYSMVCSYLNDSGNVSLEQKKNICENSDTLINIPNNQDYSTTGAPSSEVKCKLITKANGVCSA